MTLAVAAYSSNLMNIQLLSWIKKQKQNKTKQKNLSTLVELNKLRWYLKVRS